MINDVMKRKLIVKGIEKDNLGNIQELLVEECRLIKTDSKDIQINAQNLRNIIIEILSERETSSSPETETSQKYTITNPIMYWLERDTHNVNINNATTCVVSPILYQTLYVEVMSDEGNDVTTYMLGRNGNSVNITFIESQNKPYREDGYLKEERYTVKVYDDEEKQNEIGEENIVIYYLYLSSNDRFSELCRAVGTVFYLGPNGTARLNIESNTRFPIHVEYDSNNDDNDDINVEIGFENNDSEVVTVTMRAGTNLRNSNFEERGIKCVKVYSTTNRTLLKTISYLVVYNPDSTEPLD